LSDLAIGSKDNMLVPISPNNPALALHFSCATNVKRRKAPLQKSEAATRGVTFSLPLAFFKI
jgi:hypothetical protein